MNRINQICLLTAIEAIVVLLIGAWIQQPALYKPFAVVAAVSLAIGLGAVPSLKVIAIQHGLLQQLLLV